MNMIVETKRSTALCFLLLAIVGRVGTGADDVDAPAEVRPVRVDSVQPLNRDNPPTEEQIREYLKRRQPARERARRRTDLRQCLMHFTNGLARNVHVKDTLASKLLMEYLDTWRAKVESLEEFGGEELEREVEFAPAGWKRLELVRLARKELPLFVDVDRSREQRTSEFGRFLIERLEEQGAAIPRSPRLKISDQNWQRWEAVDVTPYRKEVDELRTWLAAEYERTVTPAMIRTAQLQVRFSEWLLRLKVGVLKRNHLLIGLPGYTGDRKSRKVVDQVILESHNALLEAHLLDTDREITPDDLAELAPEIRALYEYMRVARKHNPIFSDLDQVVPRDEIAARSKRYIKSGRAEEEEAAREQAILAIERAVRQKQSQPKPERDDSRGAPTQRSRENNTDNGRDRSQSLPTDSVPDGQPSAAAISTPASTNSTVNHEGTAAAPLLPRVWSWWIGILLTVCLCCCIVLFVWKRRSPSQLTGN